MKKLAISRGKSERPARGLLGTALLGGALMYLFDPYKGNARRSRVGAQGRHLIALARNVGSSRAVRQMAALIPGLTSGTIANIRSRLHPEPVTDDILVARVRSKLGHVSPHYSEIDVTVREGVVTLSGSLPRVERKELVEATSSVQGVKAVVEDLGE